MVKPEENNTENMYDYYGLHNGGVQPPHMQSTSTLKTQDGGMGGMGHQYSDWQNNMYQYQHHGGHYSLTTFPMAHPLNYGTMASHGAYPYQNGEWHPNSTGEQNR